MGQSLSLPPKKCISLIALIPESTKEKTWTTNLQHHSKACVTLSDFSRHSGEITQVWNALQWTNTFLNQSFLVPTNSIHNYLCNFGEIIFNPLHWALQTCKLVLHSSCFCWTWKHRVLQELNLYLLFHSPSTNYWAICSDGLTSWFWSLLSVLHSKSHGSKGRLICLG